MKSKFHKKIRLDAAIYKTPDLPCSITICTKDKLMIFKNQELAETTVNLLKEIAASNEIPIYAYCIMPDHIHLLVSASVRKGIVEFVGEFKSRVSRLAWGYNFKGNIWQKSFYDHFLRKEENVKAVARYIINNPVRQGIVLNSSDYQFCGSLVYDL